VDLKDYDQAVVYLKQAVMLEPRNYETLANLAQVYAAQGKFDEALRIDKKLLHLHRTVAVYNNMGAIYYMEGNMKAAEDSFRNALLSPYAYPEIYFNLARVYLKEGRDAEAQKIFLKGQSL
jgi:Flp pilus assembly protein TadD